MKYYVTFFLLIASGVFAANHFSNSKPAANIPLHAMVVEATRVPEATRISTAPPPPPLPATTTQSSTISAKSFISAVIDAEGNVKIVAGKNSSAKLPIASVTKLMTAIVAVNNYNLAEEIAVPQEASNTEGSSRKLKVGETFFIGDLLYPLLIESDNVAGITLASHIGGGRFVELMNQEALKLGLHDTYYVNPTGLDPDDGLAPNYSTAEDIAQLALIITKDYPDILNILSLKEFDLKTASGMFHHKLATTNKLLGETLPFTILGGKTGETPLAKKNLVLITREPGESSYRISVVLGSDDNFWDMKKILTFSTSE